MQATYMSMSARTKRLIARVTSHQPPHNPSFSSLASTASTAPNAASPTSNTGVAGAPAPPFRPDSLDARDERDRAGWRRPIPPASSMPGLAFGEGEEGPSMVVRTSRLKW